MKCNRPALIMIIHSGCGIARQASASIPLYFHNRFCACAFSADGNFALSGDGDGKLRLWDMETRQCVQTRWENTDYVLACEFIPDDCQALRPFIRGNYLALCASADHALRLWEI